MKLNQLFIFPVVAVYCVMLGCVKEQLGVIGSAAKTALTGTAVAGANADDGKSKDQKTETKDQAAGEQHPAMLKPALANKTAPDEYKVKFETTKGDFVVKVVRAWSPNGADRFYNLVDIGYYKDVVIFRAIKGFMFQFGIHGDPKVNREWMDANIPDDPKGVVSNKPGYLSFATSGPNSRSNQIFINLGSNENLDELGFTPFGQVVEGQEVVQNINTNYGENSREVQGQFQGKGNEYILKKYPKLDIIKSAKLLTGEGEKKEAESK
jgi:peptidyl-prolyl cis-trans isomerase A (cyclophilin A)